MSKIRIFLLLMLTALAWSGIMAGDFNPSNPPEPDDIYVYKHNVKVTATPEGKGYTSGSGRYGEGTTVTISTSSAVANWVFKRWLKNGELDTEHTSASFRFVLSTQDVEFTAEYEYIEPQEPDDPEPPELPPFEPDDPAEPETPVFPDKPDDPEPPVVIPKYVLDIVSDPFEACSFNINSGNKYTAGTRVALNATGNLGFVFKGWYDSDDTLLSTTRSWVYTMSESDATVIARWTFDPDSPDDPMSDQTNVENTIIGDVNDDRNFTILDVMMAVNYSLGGSPAGFNFKAADINEDGRVTILDILMLINIVSSH